MCINTGMYPRRNSMQNSGPVKSRMPRRHSMTSRPPRPSRQNSFNNTMASMMIDTYEADRVSEIMNNQQQQQQQQRQRQRPRKSVCFDEVVMVRPVLPLEQYTDQEIISSWYLPIEKKRMKQEIMSIIKVVKKKNESSEKQFNVRGLEWLAAKDRSRERKRKASIMDILNEQKSQREAHASQQRDDEIDGQFPESLVYDFKAFRKTYKRHSRAALHLAYTMGRIDEVEAGIRPQEDFHNSMGSTNSSDSGSLRSSRSMRSVSSRSLHKSTSQRSISTKGPSSRKTRSGSRRFSLGPSSSSLKNDAKNASWDSVPEKSSKNASWDTIVGGTVSVA